MKEYNLNWQYTSKYSKFENIQGYEREDTIRQLLKSVRLQQPVFQNAASSSEGTVKASYAIAKTIGIDSKPFSDGDFAKRCLFNAAEFVCPNSVKDFEKSVCHKTRLAEEWKILPAM